MVDNRLCSICVIRAVQCSESVYGDETVQARFERDGIAAAAWHAYARTRPHTGRCGTSVRCESTNGIELGRNAGRGSAGVATQALGQADSFEDKQRARLAKLLVQGAIENGFATEMWTLARVGKLIEREFGHRFSTTHVWRVLREMGFSSQRPVGRAIQRDEQAIARWKTKRWPGLKKTPHEATEP